VTGKNGKNGKERNKRTISLQLRFFHFFIRNKSVKNKNKLKNKKLHKYNTANTTVLVIHSLSMIYN
jgi:hypothetical protein